MSRSFSRLEAPIRNNRGSSQSSPAVSFTSTRYRMASLAARMPPAALTPTRRSAKPAKSRTASSMTRVTGSVAAGATLPVEVLMKSAPASIASQEARRTLSSVPSSPFSRITFRCASPQAPRTAAISSNTSLYRPLRKAPLSMTMSTSSAPAATVDFTFASLTSSAARPDGNAVATLATWIGVPATPATATRSGYTHTAATGGAPRPGCRALAHIARTLPGVSCPSSVVRSITEIARSSACRLLSALIDRLASVSARARAPTSSTPGSPCRNRRSDSSEAATSRITSIRPLSHHGGWLSGHRSLDLPPEREHRLLVSPDDLQRRDHPVAGGHRQRERGKPGHTDRRGQLGEREPPPAQQRRRSDEGRQHQHREVGEQRQEGGAHQLPGPVRRRAVGAGEPGAALQVPPDVRAELVHVRHQVGVAPEPLGVDDHAGGVERRAEVATRSVRHGNARGGQRVIHGGVHRRVHAIRQ